MKINVEVVVFLVALAVLGVRSECCKRTAMYWSASSCSPYREDYFMDTTYEGDLSMMMPARCIAKVCGDGKVHAGFYCGIGKCNAVGCNCEGGCHEGDAQENFRRITGITTATAGISLKDPTTWG